MKNLKLKSFKVSKKIYLQREINRPLELIRGQKETFISRHYKFYFRPENYDPKLEQAYLLGKDLYVVGQISDSFMNSNSVVSVLEEFTPDGILLGDMNKSDFNELREGKAFYLNHLKDIKIRPEDLFAKEPFTKYFQEEFKNGLGIYKMPHMNTIYKPIASQSRAMFDDTLSAAHFSYQEMKTKLLFAKPDDILINEDIVLRKTLGELQDAFFSVLKNIQEEIVKENKYQFFENEYIYQMIKEKTKQLYRDDFFAKWMIYSASIAKKSLKNIGKTTLIMPYFLAGETMNYCKETLLPEYDEVFRSFLKKEALNERKSEDQTTRKMKLLKSYGMDPKQYLKMENEVRKNSTLYNYIEKERKNYEQNIEGRGNSADEILEKYAIVSFLINNKERIYMSLGQNPFKATIFEKTLSNAYPDQEALFMKYQEYIEKYRTYVFDLRDFQVKRLEKDEEHCGRMRIISMNEQVEKLSKVNQGGPPRFNYGLINQMKQQVIIIQKIYERIAFNIQKKIMEGVSQADILLQLKQYMNGHYSEENIGTFKRLVAEANSDLGLLRLPDFFSSEVPFVADLKIKQYQDKIKEIFEYLRKQQEEINFELEQTNNYSGFAKKLKIKVLRTEMMKRLQNYETYDQEIKKMKMRNLIDKNIEDMLPEDEKKVMSVVLAPEETDMKEFTADLENKSIEDLKEMGMDVITSLDLELLNDGSHNVPDMDEEKKRKIKDIIESLESTKETKE